MAERLYSLLLRLYPRGFRRRYADEMMRVFRERLRDERAVRVWVDVLADAAVSIPRQHFRARRPHPMLPPSAAPLKRAVLVNLSRSFLAGSGISISIFAAFFPNGRLLAVLLALICLALLARTCQKARVVKTYRIDLGDDYVTVACDAIGIAPLTLTRGEVTGLRVFQHIGMRVHASDPSRDLWVPSSAPAYAEARQRLSQWAPVSVTPFRLTGAANGAGVDTLGGLAMICLAWVLPFSFAVGFAAASTVPVVTAIALARRKNFPRSRLAPTLAHLLIVLVVLVRLIGRWLW
jgi:hypothetical protein